MHSKANPHSNLSKYVKVYSLAVQEANDHNKASVLQMNYLVFLMESVATMAIGDDTDGDAPLGEEVAAGRGGSGTVLYADAGLAMPALEVEPSGHR